MIKFSTQKWPPHPSEKGSLSDRQELDLENEGRIGRNRTRVACGNVRELNGIHGLWTGDVNAHGTKNLLADSIMGPQFPKSLAWFQFPTAHTHTFTRHIMTKEGADGRPHYLDFADLNGDRRGDLLVGNSGGGTFTWWENPGTTNSA